METKILLENLDIVKTALSTKQFMPILSHFCFFDDKVRAYNGELLIEKNFSLGHDIVIPGEFFYKYLSTLGSKVEFKCKNTELTIVSDKFTSKLMGLSVTEFPLPKETGKIKIKFSITDELIEAFNKCLIFIGKDEVKFEYRGLFLTSDFIYSTNGSIVSRYKLKNKINISKGIFLPESVCKEVIRLFDKIKTIQITDNSINLIGSDIKVFCNKVDVEFPDCSSLFKSYITKRPEVFLISDRLKQTCKQASLLMEGMLDKYFKICFQKNHLQINVNNKLLGSLEGQVHLRGLNFNNVEIGVDIELFYQALQNTKMLTLLDGTKRALYFTDDNRFDVLMSLIEE